PATKVKIPPSPSTVKRSAFVTISMAYTVLPERRLIELNTCSGPTRSSSSTGGTTTTMIRRLDSRRRGAALFDANAMHRLCRCVETFCKPDNRDGGYRRLFVGNRRVYACYAARRKNYAPSQKPPHSELARQSCISDWQPVRPKFKGYFCRRVFRAGK